MAFLSFIIYQIIRWKISMILTYIRDLGNAMNMYIYFYKTWNISTVRENKKSSELLEAASIEFNEIHFIIFL